MHKSPANHIQIKYKQTKNHTQIQEDEQPVVFANTIHNGTTTTTKDATTTPAGHTKTLQEDNVAAVGNSYVINVAKQQIRDVCVMHTKGT